MRDIFSVGLVLTWGWNYETSGNVYNVPLYLKKYPTFTTREKHFSSFLTINSTFTLFRISWDFGSMVSLITLLMLMCMISKTMLLVYKANTMLCTPSKRSHHMLWCSKAILEDVLVFFFLLEYSWFLPVVHPQGGFWLVSKGSFCVLELNETGFPQFTYNT